MNTQLTIYNFNQNQVRTTQINGEPWFVAADVCSVLDIKNTTQAVQKLDNDERSMLNIGRQGKANIVNEFGVYGLILMSRKKEAVQFKRWLIHEVLPSIRKTGAYGVPAVCEGLSADDRKTIGGIVKRCCEVVIKEQLDGRTITKTVDALSDFDFPEWGQGLEIQPRDIREGLRSLIAQIGFRMDYRDAGYSSLMKLYQFNKAVLALFERYDTIRTENLLAIELMDGNREYDKKKVLQCFKYLNKKLPTLSVCVGR